MHSRSFLTGISPCPNDTFSFYPWASDLLRLPFKLNLVFHDIETLNVLARGHAPFDITKLSTACFGGIADKYVALSSGAAFATHGGPIVVSKTPLDPAELLTKTIAIPGKHTSAYMAFVMVHGRPKAAIEMPFSTIMDRVLDGTCEAGIVIHEGRFVFSQKGLVALSDLGEAFKKKFGICLPLGVIGAKRALGMKTLHAIDIYLRMSIRYARQQGTFPPFVTDRAQELDEKTIRQHVACYVTDDTECLTDQGRAALRFFFDYACALGLLPEHEVTIL